MDSWNGVFFGSEPGASPASDPSLVLDQWLATRDPGMWTHEVATRYDWVEAWRMVLRGWQIDSASWQRREMVIKNDKGGWVILLSRRLK